MNLFEMSTQDTRDAHETLVKEVAALMHRMWAENDMTVARAVLARIADWRRLREENERLNKTAGEWKRRAFGFDDDGMIAAAVEAERAACEAIARHYAENSHVARAIADAIAARRKA